MPNVVSFAWRVKDRSRLTPMYLGIAVRTSVLEIDQSTNAIDAGDFEFQERDADHTANDVSAALRNDYVIA